MSRNVIGSASAIIAAASNGQGMKDAWLVQSTSIVSLNQYTFIVLLDHRSHLHLLCFSLVSSLIDPRGQSGHFLLMANSVPPREERDTHHQLNRITTCKTMPTNKTPRSEGEDTLNQLKRIGTCKTLPTNKTLRSEGEDTLHQLKRMSTCKSLPTNKSKGLHRAKTGTLNVSGRSCTKQDLARERSFAVPKEEEALTQVINFVSKRFVNTHQGVLPQKETRQQQKRREQSADNTNDYVKINISGVTFKTKLETLQRYPQTLLG